MTAHVPDQPPEPRKRSWFRRHKILTGLGAIIALIIIVSVANSGGGSDTSHAAASPHPTATSSPTPKNTYDPASDEQKIVAKTMCEQFVTDRLKSPSSAKFGPSLLTHDLDHIVFWYPGMHHYIVHEYADSENSFGADIRSDFSCTVKPRKHGDKWHLVTLTGLS